MTRLLSTLDDWLFHLGLAVFVAVLLFAVIHNLPGEDE